MDHDQDLTHAPVPDRDRLSRCTVTVLEPESVECYGPPAAVLSLARWLRLGEAGEVDLAGPARHDAARCATSLRVDPTPSDIAGATVAIEGDTLVLRGGVAALDDLADVVEALGVAALDLRWAPVARRRWLVPAGGGATVPADVDPDSVASVLGPGSCTLVLVSAYPIDDEPAAAGS